MLPTEYKLSPHEAPSHAHPVDLCQHSSTAFECIASVNIVDFVVVWGKKEVA